MDVRSGPAGAAHCSGPGSQDPGPLLREDEWSGGQKNVAHPRPRARDGARPEEPVALRDGERHCPHPVVRGAPKYAKHRTSKLLPLNVCTNVGHL